MYRIATYRNIGPTPNHTLPFSRFFPDAWVRTAREPGGSPQLGRPKVLVVEDNPLLSMQIEDALTEAGFHVVGKAASADQALAFARASRPDVMVVDIRLEGDRDGVAAAEEIYAELGIRSIFASSLGAADLRERGAAARPLAWISKPFDMDSLVGLVRDALPAKPPN